MSTQKNTTIPVLGLALQPNKYALPPGTCQIANNVFARRKGVLEPQGAPVSSGLAPSTGRVPARMFCEWNQEYYAAIERPTASMNGTALHFSDTTAFVFRPPVASGRAMRFTPGESQTSFVRGRHVFTEYNAPIVVEAVGTTSHGTPRQAGLVQPVTLEWIGAPTPDPNLPLVLLADSVVGYRAVIRRIKDDFTLTSAPTFPFLANNNNPTATTVSLRVYFANTGTEPFELGDKVIVYRTPNASSIAGIGDDYREVASCEIQTGDLAFSYVFIEDKTFDADRRSPLYTNSLQETETQRNLMPPASVDVLTYQDTTFYATKNSWPAITLSVPTNFGFMSDPTSYLNGVGSRLMDTAVATVGTFTALVSAANRVGLTIGQQSSMASSFILFGTLPATVLSIVPTGPNYTITFDRPFLVAPTIFVPLAISDVMTITATKDGVPVAFTVRLVHTNTNFNFAQTDSFSELARSLLFNVLNVRGFYVAATQFSSVDIASGLLGTSFVVYSPVPGLWDSFTIDVTNGRNFSDADVDDVTGIGHFDSIQDTKRNRIFFSKTQEPEHVPPVNFFDVGADKILRMVQTESSVLVLCTDGLFRFSGTGAPWTVTPVDKTVRLLHPDAVGTLSGNAFAWLTDGLAMVSEGGVTNVSTTAVGPLLEEWTETFRSLNTVPGWGPSLVGDELHNDLWLNVSLVTNAGAIVVNNIGTLLLNTDTSSYTTQDGNPLIAQTYVPYLLQVVSATTAAYTVPSLTAWMDAQVTWNPITSGDMGMLKQWLDVNLFLEDVNFATDLQFIFSNQANAFNIRTVTPATANKVHCLVPRRCSVREQLVMGFTTEAVFWRLYGFTARARVASETLKR